VSEPTYAEAVAELEAILVRLERDDVDVDHLAEQVQRAAVLLRLCRSKLAAAKVEIEAVLGDVDD
jgi:exodeoxyribonuclease VII small subunit